MSSSRTDQSSEKIETENVFEKIEPEQLALFVLADKPIGKMDELDSDAVTYSSELIKMEDASEAEQDDLFVCEIANWPIKDDLASMEIPLFSLSKNQDTETREYRRGNKTIRIIPSSVGAATVFDKDLLLYIASHIVEARNQGKPVSRTVVIDSNAFLQGTERGDGRASFERLLDMLRRLRGTTIETNIPTNGQVQTDGFSLINSYKVLSGASSRNGKNCTLRE